MTALLAIGDDVETLLKAVKANHTQSIKEVLRHILLRSGTHVILDKYRHLKGFKTADYIDQDATLTFQNIYSGAGWVHEDGQDSASGVGSSDLATMGLFDAIQTVMAKLGAKSIVDVGCGDWNWMQQQTISVDYTGVDIVPDIIEKNQAFARESVRFIRCNAVETPPPTADFALCREVLFHLSFGDALAALRNIASASDHVCTTTDVDIWFNSDIQTGDFRLLNMMKKPFSLPRPLALIADNYVTKGRFLAVWPSDVIAGRLSCVPAP